MVGTLQAHGFEANDARSGAHPGLAREAILRRTIEQLEQLALGIAWRLEQLRAFEHLHLAGGAARGATGERDRREHFVGGVHQIPSVRQVHLLLTTQRVGDEYDDGHFSAGMIPCRAMLALSNDGGPHLTRDQPRPERPPGEVRLRLRLAGVCDTDLQLARGYMGFSGVLGHELVGSVVEADDPALLGRRMVTDINAACGECDDCRERDGHHCERRTVLGILGRDGAFAEELVMPSRCLVPVPDSVPDDHAVFAEPLAAALHVLDEVEAGAPVTVLGDGKLGLLIALALAGAGVATTLVGHHRDKLAIAARAGVTTLLEAELGARRAQVVVEATGSPGGLSLATRMLVPRGTLILKTTVADAVPFDAAPIVVNELRVVGSRCGDLRRAIAALAEGRIDPTPLIVARYPLSRADEALAHAGRRGTLKVLVEGV